MPMSSAADDLSLPSEVARLGRPEQIFDLSAGRLAGGQIATVVFYAIFMVPAFAIAIIMFLNGIIGLHPTPPPPSVNFGAGSFFLACGLGLGYSSYRILVTNRRTEGTYYIFRDFLVVACPGRPTRQIAW